VGDKGSCKAKFSAKVPVLMPISNGYHKLSAFFSFLFNKLKKLINYYFEISEKESFFCSECNDSRLKIKAFRKVKFSEKKISGVITQGRK
jgi:hypothetical protein